LKILRRINNKFKNINDIVATFIFKEFDTISNNIEKDLSKSQSDFDLFQSKIQKKIIIITLITFFGFILLFFVLKDILHGNKVILSNFNLILKHGITNISIKKMEGNNEFVLLNDMLIDIQLKLKTTEVLKDDFMFILLDNLQNVKKGILKPIDKKEFEVEILENIRLEYNRFIKFLITNIGSDIPTSILQIQNISLFDMRNKLNNDSQLSNSINTLNDNMNNMLSNSKKQVENIFHLKGVVLRFLNKTWQALEA